MINSILEIISKFIPDQTQRDKAAVEISQELTKQMDMQRSIISKEQNSDTWLTRNWRPLTMVIFLSIIVIHWVMYDIFPYINDISELDLWVPADPGLPAELYSTIRLGLGGYIGGRSVEKIVSRFSK